MQATREQRIWQVVASIPRGYVATYGQVAELADVPRGARLVGRTMSQLPKDSKLPWHRVVNAAGRLSLQGSAYDRQKDRLRAEEVLLVNGRINLKRFRWAP